MVVSNAYFYLEGTLIDTPTDQADRQLESFFKEQDNFIQQLYWDNMVAEQYSILQEGAISNIFHSFVEFFKKVGKWIVDFVKKGVNAIKNKIRSIKDKMRRNKGGSSSSSSSSSAKSTSSEKKKTNKSNAKQEKEEPKNKAAAQSNTQEEEPKEEPKEPEEPKDPNALDFKPFKFYDVLKIQQLIEDILGGGENNGRALDLFIAYIQDVDQVADSYESAPDNTEELLKFCDELSKVVNNHYNNISNNISMEAVPELQDVLKDQNAATVTIEYIKKFGIEEKSDAKAELDDADGNAKEIEDAFSNIQRQLKDLIDSMAVIEKATSSTEFSNMYQDTASKVKDALTKSNKIFENFTILQTVVLKTQNIFVTLLEKVYN